MFRYIHGYGEIDPQNVSSGPPLFLGMVVARFGSQNVSAGPPLSLGIVEQSLNYIGRSGVRKGYLGLATRSSELDHFSPAQVLFSNSLILASARLYPGSSSSRFRYAHTLGYLSASFPRALPAPN